MVVDDLHVFGCTRVPPEAQAPLAIDANAVLTVALALQRFEAIARRDAQVIKPHGDLELPKLAPRNAGAGLESPHTIAAGQCCSFRASERPDHDDSNATR